MFAFVLPIFLFFFWSVIGYTLLLLLDSRKQTLRNLLAAPVIGFAFLVLTVFTLSRTGLPVRAFANELTIALLLIALFVVFRVRPQAPIRAYIPFATILLLALALSGWPLLRYGYGWLGLGNNDMVTSSFAAQYFMRFGFFDGPADGGFLRDTDYSQYLWTLYVGVLHRVGNELLLSWFAVVVGARPDELYMPFGLALHLCLISATGSLVMLSPKYRLAAIVSCALMATSAISTEAVLNQLSSQVGGLALLATSAALLLRPIAPSKWSAKKGRACLSAIVVAASLVYYPEMLPFLSLAVMLFFLVAFMRYQVNWLGVLAFFGVVFFLVVTLLHNHLPAVFQHILGALAGGGGARDALSNTYFPYYYLPSGLAILWSLQTYHQVLPDPLGSITILVGGLLLVFAFVAVIRQTWAGSPVATIGAIMFALAIVFVFKRSDFGLFKLAMYVQPFMLGTVAVVVCGYGNTVRWRIFPILILGLASVFAQYAYTKLSADEKVTSLGIWKGSKADVKAGFQHIVENLPPGKLVLDTPIAFLSGLQALQLLDREAIFSQDLAARGFHQPSPLQSQILAFTNPTAFGVFDAFRKSYALYRQTAFLTGKFQLKETSDQSGSNSFATRRFSGIGDAWFVDGSSSQSIFNRRWATPETRSGFIVSSLQDVKNHLVFVDSQLGSQYYGGANVAFYQLEPDLFFPAKTMTALGRHLLFQVVNPSDAMRMVVSVTASLNANGDNRLPPAVVIGAERKALPLVGRGSARIFSEPFRSQILDGIPFVAIDMGASGSRFSSRRSGLMQLYGLDVPLDRRRVVGFGREISLISDEEYRSLNAPRELSAFPVGLDNPALEYSGLYEDGWVGESAYVRLKSDDSTKSLRIEGMIPLIDNPSFSSELVIQIDGAEVHRMTAGLGEFKVNIPVSNARGTRRVSLTFSSLQKLPGADGRPVAALIRYVGFS
jgi:hypothetical protein